MLTHVSESHPARVRAALSGGDGPSRTPATLVTVGADRPSLLRGSLITGYDSSTSGVAPVRLRIDSGDGHRGAERASRPASHCSNWPGIADAARGRPGLRASPQGLKRSPRRPDHRSGDDHALLEGVGRASPDPVGFSRRRIEARKSRDVRRPPLHRSRRILARERVHLVDASLAQTVQAVSRWGSGSRDLVAAVKPSAR